MVNFFCVRFIKFFYLNFNYKLRFDNLIKYDLLEKDKIMFLFDIIIFFNNCLFI